MAPEDLLSHELIEIALQNDKGKGAKLISWTHENCTKTGDNFFNVVKRINVRYILDGEENGISYVAKLSPCKVDDLFTPYRNKAMIKEVFFYKDLLPLLNIELNKLGQENLRVPRYLHSYTEEEKEVLIFEDLDLRGFGTFDRSNKMDEAHTRLMVNEISRLHAASLALQKASNNVDLAELYPLLIETWISGEDNLRYAFSEIFNKGCRHNLNLVKALGGFEELMPWLQRATTDSMKLVLKELESTPPWRGICHGDLHRTNVLFRYNERNVPVEIMVVDWQTLRMANIASDIDYLAFSSFFNPDRDEFMPFIIETYYNTFLNIHGPSTFFTKNEFENEVKQNHFGLLLCYYIVPLSLCVTKQSELFLLDDKEFEKSEDEALEEAKNLLANKKNLSHVLVDYLHHIHEMSKLSGN